MTNELQQNRYDQLVRRVGGIIGPGSKVNEALSELFPVLEVEDTVPELMALAGWSMAFQSTERPAVAGQNSATNLLNPPNSGVLIALTQVIIRSSVSPTVVQMEPNVSSNGGPQVPGLFRDTRFGVARNSTGKVSSVDNQAVGGGLRLHIGTEPLSIRDDNGIAVLTPDTSFRIGTVTNNVVLTVNYFWRERAAQPSELSF